MGFTQKPLVHRLEFKQNHDEGTLVVKEEVNQDCIPENRQGAFNISGEVFVNANGFIYMTGIKIGESNVSDLGKTLRSYYDLTGGYDSTIYFTLDKEKV